MPKSGWDKDFYRVSGQRYWARVYLYTGLQAHAGAIAPGSVVRYAGGIQQMVQAVSDLLYSWDYLHNYRGRMEEFFAYLDLPEKGHNSSAETTGWTVSD